MGFLSRFSRLKSGQSVGDKHREPRLASASPAAPDAPVLDRHQAVIDADPYSFQVSHRRMAWMLRMSAMTNVGQLAALIVSINLIAEMLPLKTTEFVFIREHVADDRIYRIEPISRSVPGFDVMMEGMAKRYVSECLAVDPVSQGERMRWCARISEAKFWERFTDENKKRVDDMVDSRITRSIEHISVERLQTAGNVFKYVVDFRQTDEQRGKLIEAVPRRAYLNLTTRPGSVREADKYENPHGITVLDISVRKRPNP